MPKVKPDQVIRHEVVLGRADRELLEGAVMAYQMNRIAEPLVKLLNDVTGLTAFLSILAALTGFTFLISDDLNANELIDVFLTQREQHIIKTGAQTGITAAAGPLDFIFEILFKGLK